MNARGTLTLWGLAVGALLARGPLARAQAAETDDDNDAADDSADTDAPETVPVAPAKGGIPRTHVIRAGETLSTLSQQYLRDRMAWPQLWALNPDITNPNRVYPGQVVRLGGPAPKEAKVAVAAPEPAVDVARAHPVAARPLVARRGMIMRPAALAQPAAPHLRQLGFIDEGTLKATGTVKGSQEEKIMLATGDQAYVQFPPGQVPKPGARYSVYQVDTAHPLREAGSTTVIGYQVHVSGEVVIEDSSSDSGVATGRLVNLAEPVERGYRVGPLLPQLRQIAPKKNEASLTARVIAAVDPGTMISSERFVVLNRGRRHGVEAGNRFLVQRQSEGLKRMMEGWDTTDPNFPPHTVAEILAVDVQDETTIGWVSRGDRELRVGDVADLQLGY